MEYTDEEYFALDKISNSLLGQVDSIINNRSLMKASEATLEYGRQLHEACLEPLRYQSNLHKPEYQKNKHTIYNMSKSLRSNALFILMCNKPGVRFEKVHEWNEDRYDLECKAKIDIEADETIGDVKSTSALTLAEFIALIIEYGYDRQAAFYLDGRNKKRFIFFGVSKKYPHPTFTVAYNWNDPIIIEARKKYEYLIDEYIKLKQNNLLNINP
jgi:hypothetical protein